MHLPVSSLTHATNCSVTVYGQMLVFHAASRLLKIISEATSSAIRLWLKFVHIYCHTGEYVPPGLLGSKHM